MPKDVYWPKKCLLVENVPIEWKYAYWPKMCLLAKNAPIEMS